jgi:hypothetical protein
MAPYKENNKAIVAKERIRIKLAIGPKGEPDTKKNW